MLPSRFVPMDTTLAIHYRSNPAPPPRCIAVCKVSSPQNVSLFGFHAHIAQPQKRIFISRQKTGAAMNGQELAIVLDRELRTFIHVKRAKRFDPVG